MLKCLLLNSLTQSSLLSVGWYSLTSTIWPQLFPAGVVVSHRKNSVFLKSLWRFCRFSLIRAEALMSGFGKKVLVLHGSWTITFPCSDYLSILREINPTEPHKPSSAALLSLQGEERSLALWASCVHENMQDFCGKVTEPPNLPVFQPCLCGFAYRVCRPLDVYMWVKSKLALLFPSDQEFCCFISEYQYFHEIQTPWLPHSSMSSLLNQSSSEMSQLGVMDSHLYIIYSKLVPGYKHVIP